MDVIEDGMHLQLASSTAAFARRTPLTSRSRSESVENQATISSPVSPHSNFSEPHPPTTLRRDIVTPSRPQRVRSRRRYLQINTLSEAML